MELIAHIRHRVGYVWYWRARHWWLDTQGGRVAQITTAVLLALGTVAETVHVTLSALAPPAGGAPHQAIIGVIIVLIVALVAAVVAIAMMPKPKQPAAQQAQTPVTDDGQNARRAYGAVWVDDSFLLAWAIVGRDPIKASGGK